MKLFGTLMLLAGLALGSVAIADTGTATTKPASCCGEKCKKMEGCCKADASGKMTCSMGGGCCVK